MYDVCCCVHAATESLKTREPPPRKSWPPPDDIGFQRASKLKRNEIYVAPALGEALNLAAEPSTDVDSSPRVEAPLLSEVVEAVDVHRYLEAPLLSAKNIVLLNASRYPAVDGFQGTVCFQTHSCEHPTLVTHFHSPMLESAADEAVKYLSSDYFSTYGYPFRVSWFQPCKTGHFYSPFAPSK